MEDLLNFMYLFITLKIMSFGIVVRKMFGIQVCYTHKVLIKVCIE